MRALRHLIVMLVGLTLVASTLGCKTTNAKDDSLITKQLKIPEHFKHIPADTPYVMADIEPFPYDELDWQFIESYGALVTELRDQLTAEARNMPGDSVDKELQLVLAILDELDGNMSPEGLKTLGVAIQGHISLYGVGAFPVYRLELSDSDKFEAMVSRIEAKVGEEIPRATRGEHEYRELRADELVIPILITDDELVFGMTHANFADTFIDYMTGDKMPERSLYQDNALLEMMRKHSFKPYVAGYLDVTRLVAVVTGEDTSSLLAQSLLAAGLDAPDIEASCRAEYNQLAAAAPRFIMGYDEITRTHMAATFGLEMNTPLAARLASARGSIPGFTSAKRNSSLFSYGMGVDLKALVEVLRGEAKRLGEDPFQCPELVEINDMAAAFNSAAQQIPPFISTLLGADVSLLGLDLDSGMVTRLQGTAVIRMAEPDALMGTLKLLVPELTNLTIKPGDAPVALTLPQDLAALGPGVTTPYIAMSDDAIGLCIGEGTQAHMLDLINAPAQRTPLMSIAYDMAKIVELIDDGADISAGDEFAGAALGVYESMGALKMDVDIDATGLYTRMRVEMVPKTKGR
jgi:hypothetical protein